MPGSCGQYIECQTGGKGEVYSCASPSIAFDVKSQACTQKLDSSSTCANRCEGKNAVWAADPTNCHGFFYCIDGIPYAGHCYEGMHFDESTQMCVTTTTSSCVDVSSICELVPDKTKFRDETDCSAYYECSSKKLSRKSCSKTYFDVEAQACVDKTKVQCTAHPIPANICIESKKPFVGLKADQATCRGFFNCLNLGTVEDLEPRWGQCPEGTFFSQADQACINPIDVKCEYNRCDGRGNRMVSSHKNNCHDYLICEDGFVVAEKTCPYDYFFDELYQACVPDIIYYNCCDVKK